MTSLENAAPVPEFPIPKSRGEVIGPILVGVFVSFFVFCAARGPAWCKSGAGLAS